MIRKSPYNMVSTVPLFRFEINWGKMATTQGGIIVDSELKASLAELNTLLTSLAPQSLGSQSLLDALTQFCVDDLNAAFARIWLIDESGNTLLLKSSRGQYTRLDGTRSRIAVGQGSKIDKMYTHGTPHITNDVLNDPGVKDKEWAKREGFCAFAGYPLSWGGQKLGVLGMYSRVLLSQDILSVMGVFVLVTSAIIFQMNQTERDMSRFCEVTGFRPALLQRLICLGRAGTLNANAMSNHPAPAVA